MSRHYIGTEFITGLRGLAAFLVFLIHSGGGGLRGISPEFNSFVDWGKYGVIIFFVISGYTIFFQIYERKYSLKRFLAVRLLRISIPYYPVLILLFVAGIYGVNIGSNPWGNGAHGLDISWLNWVLHFTYLNFWDVKYSNSVIGIEWTLGVEVFYYFVLGIVLSLIWVRKTLVLSTLVLGLMLYAVSQIGLGLEKTAENYLNIHWSPMIYGYLFLLGGAAYLSRKELEKSKYENKLYNALSDITVVLIIALLISNLMYIYWQDISLMYAYMTFFSLIFIRDGSIFGRLLSNPVAIFFGSISYSFYIWHYLIITTSLSDIVYFQESDLGRFMYNFVLTVTVATVWYYVFERKIYLKVKNRLNER